MEIPRGLVRTGLRGAATALVLSSCSLTPTESAPTTIAEPTTTSEPFDHCEGFGSLDGREPILPFDASRFTSNDQPAYAYEVLQLVEATQPDLTPPQLANAFIDSQADRIGDGLTVVFDESIGLDAWASGDTEDAQDERQGQKTNLLSLLIDTVEVIDDYPDDMLPGLGVDTIRLANTYAQEFVGGHFDASNGEIQVEYEPGNLPSRWEIYHTVAHEIGHAIHTAWCGDINTSRDLQLQGNIHFLGQVPLDATDEEILAHYDQVPPEQLAYGPDRVFPREYGATNVQEYFATIVEHLIEDRGLILPGDADYGSPLQRNQELVVERTETLFPGFRTFIEQHTRMLRLSPHSELYQDLPVQTLERDVVTFAAAQTNSEDPLVINGIMLHVGVFNNERRGGNLSILPGFQIYGQRASLYIEQYGDLFGSGTSYPLDRVEGSPPEIILFPLVEGDINSLLVPQSQANSEFAAAGLAPRSGTWSGDVRAQDLIDQLIARGLQPIRIQLPRFAEDPNITLNN